MGFLRNPIQRPSESRVMNARFGKQIRPCDIDGVARSNVKRAKSRQQAQPPPAVIPRRARLSPQVLLGAAVILVGTILVYLPAIRGGFIWDDPQYVINNPTLRDLQGLYEIWFIP